MNVNDYIIPYTAPSASASGETNGVGVIVGNLFITAGHVIADCEFLYFCINHGKRFKLRKDEALVFFPPHANIKGEDYDLAVFKLDNINSPLCLAHQMPSNGKRLTSISHKRKVIPLYQGEGEGIFGNINTETYECILSEGIVTESEANYFACDMSVPLEPGRSGSPIMSSNFVYGILHGGKNDGKLCVYQSSESIVNLLKSHDVII